jgi:hypothetical protein
LGWITNISVPVCMGLLAKKNLAPLDHYLNQTSVGHMNRILVAPPPLMGKWKGVSNGQRVNVDQIKGQKVAQTNEEFPHNSFSFEFMSKIMMQSNERNGVC